MDIHRYIGFAQAIFALALIMVFPLIDLPAMRRLQRYSSGAARLDLYKRSVASTWIFTFVAIMLASPVTLLIVPRQSGDLPWMDDYAIVFVIVIAIITALFAWILWPSAQCALSHRIRQQYFQAYRSSAIRFLLPVSHVERLWWVWLSLAAGIGEELLYRGFILQYLRGHLVSGPALTLTLAWLLSSFAFGLGHVYQGVRGVLQTTIAGLVFGLLAILSGGLFLPMTLHTLMDLRILLTYHPSQDAPDEAATLISGFSSQNR